MAVDLEHGDTRLIIAECKTRGLLRNQTAYVLGTGFWETAQTMQPVRETLANSDDAAKQRLENAWNRGKLPWVSTPYWRGGFFGRGYVQLTHVYNYRKAGDIIGVDLVSDPDLALNPEIAARILVQGMIEGWFTGKKLGDYVTLKASNYRGARRVVNGTDKAATIAELAREYEAALLAEGYGIEPVAPVVNDRLDGTPPRDTPMMSTTLQATVTAALANGTQLWGQAMDLVDQVAKPLGLEPGQALALVALVSLGWIFRERLRKWAAGDR